jgi:hypothetical protein
LRDFEVASQSRRLELRAVFPLRRIRHGFHKELGILEKHLMLEMLRLADGA